MWDWITRLDELRRAGHPVALVTLVHTRGSTPREPGAKMLVLEDGTFFGSIGGGHLEHLALRDAKSALATGTSQTFRYPLGAKLGQCCGGVVDVFIEVVNHGPRLYLFGAGHVARALTSVLDGTPFHVHLIDEREEWVHAPMVPSSVQRHPESWERFVTRARWDPLRTYVAVMTHRHDEDQAIIADVIERPARFIGLIGSETKWTRFRQRLEARGIGPARLDRVQCPIGLPIGGKAPQEVAISIAAELLRVHHARGVLPLPRERAEAPEVSLTTDTDVPEIR